MALQRVGQRLEVARQRLLQREALIQPVVHGDRVLVPIGPDALGAPARADLLVPLGGLLLALALGRERHGLALDRIHARQAPDARLIERHRAAALLADRLQPLQFGAARFELAAERNRLNREKFKLRTDLFERPLMTGDQMSLF